MVPPRVSRPIGAPAKISRHCCRMDSPSLGVTQLLSDLWRPRRDMRAARVARRLGHSTRGGGNPSGRRSPLAPIPDIVAPGLPGPYQFPARIEPFQAFAAPFPGEPREPAFAAAPSSATPPTEAPRRETDDGLFQRGLRRARRARPIACERRQAERLRRNRTLGLLVQGRVRVALRTSMEHRLKLVNKWFRSYCKLCCDLAGCCLAVGVLRQS